jgi:hypothetical protein
MIEGKIEKKRVFNYQTKGMMATIGREMEFVR